MWIPIAWSVLSVLSLLDKDNRIAAKLGIKIENYHVYEAFYKRWRESLLKGNDDEYAALMEEMQRLPDQSGFQRYFMYKCKEIVGKYPIQDETKDPSIPSV
jgi:hypothetical protein